MGRRLRRPIVAGILIVAVTALTAAVESRRGRPIKYRHGPVRLWSGDVQSDQNSQQGCYPYTFTHFEHGALFYGLLIGFFLTWRLPRRVTVAWIIAVEVILALWIRDNLFLNILMLVCPLNAVRQWQMAVGSDLVFQHSIKT